VFEKGLIVDADRWEKLSTIIKITSVREFSSGKSEIRERFYISSLAVIKTPSKRNAFNQIMVRDILCEKSNDYNASTLGVNTKICKM